MPRKSRARQFKLLGFTASGRSLEARTRLWLLRLLVHGRLVDPILNPDGRPEEDYICALDLPLDEDDLNAPKSHTIGHLIDDTAREALEELEASDAEAVPSRVVDNVHRLGQLIGLEPLDERILVLFIALQLESPFEQMMSDIAERVRGSLLSLIAVALNEPEVTVEERMGPDGVLVRAGLLSNSDHTVRGLDYDLLPGFARAVSGTMEDPEKTFRAYFRPSPEPALDHEHVPHLAEEVAILTAILEEARDSGLRGVNILLHGLPGTGKTELARLLAREAGRQAREVNHEDGQGEPLAATARQRAYHLCQHLLAQDGRSLVIFDEVEDIFDPGAGALRGLLPGRQQTGGKAWTNTMLESNTTPTVWLTNHAEYLDPAYLRRFDYTLEVRTPPRSVRRRLLERACTGLPVSASWLDQMADADRMTPAEIEGVARTARLARSALNDEQVEPFLTEQLHRRSRFQGRQPSRPARGSELLTHRLEHLNPDVPVVPILDALAWSGEGTALLHGPPGTGKTALAGAIAQRLDRPLISRPTSGILSPYVGMTERNLAALFDEAREEGAVLLLDEADSLLRSREGARNSWEVTQTNELLVQMEHFPGVFLCATNHREALDSAAMRRFDFKLAMGPLRPEQNRALFGELCAALGLEDEGEIDAALERRLGALETATPGDYATVGRRFRTQQTSGRGVTPRELVEALEAEQQLKPEAPRRRVGFV